MIERAFEARGQHEETTVAIIRNAQSGVGKALASHTIDPEAVAQIIDKSSVHQLLIDIVSSQLDADRMDYLLRDSYCTGVQYGLYDSEWILNALCVGSDQNGSGGEARSWRLCLDKRRGEKAAEQFVLARAHMNEQVYFHRVTRGYESMLLALFAEAAKLATASKLPPTTPATVVEFLHTRGAIGLDTLLRLDESQFLVAMHEWAASAEVDHGSIRRWSSAFLKRDRLLVAASLHGIDPGQLMGLGVDLEQGGLKRGVDWHDDDASSAVYKGIQYSAAKGADAEEERLESIFLASGKPTDVARPIELSSELIKSLDLKKQSLARLYFDKQCLSQATTIAAKFKIKIDSAGGET